MAKKKPLCLICNKTRENDSLRPNILRAHLQNLHPTHAIKDKIYFEKLNTSLKKQKNDNSGHFFKRNEAAVTALYEVAKMIAKTKKPHTIGEKLISPYVDVIIKLMISNEAGKKTKQVSLSKSTIKSRIVDMSENIEQ